MLEQERADHRRQGVEPAVDERAEAQADEHERGGVGFQDPLDVPLLVEILQVLVDLLGVIGVVKNVQIRLPLNFAVHLFGGIAFNAFHCFLLCHRRLAENAL